MAQEQKSFGDLVHAYLKERGGEVTAREVATKFNVTVNSANRTLGWLAKRGRISEDFETKKVLSKYGSYTRPVLGSFKYKAK